jgi:hypothetical protein
VGIGDHDNDFASLVDFASLYFNAGSDRPAKRARHILLFKRGDAARHASPKTAI